MRSLLPMSLLLALLATTPALADPGITVDYRDELLRVTLDGNYSGAYYQVWRSGDLVGQYDPLRSQFTLCTGDCFLTDLEVTPGRTYYYRFDVQEPSGQVTSYGPYPVTVPDTPIAARITPNPSNGQTRIEFSLPGSTRRDAPLDVDARLLDLQGRTVRVIHSGPLARGVNSLAWDGRGKSGQQLNSGVYFLRMTTPVGSSITRVVRFR